MVLVLFVDTMLVDNKSTQMPFPQPSKASKVGIPGSRSLTGINKNQQMHLLSTIPAKTTPIQIGPRASTHKNTCSIVASHNPSKLQLLKQNFWPSSLPSSAPTSSTIPQSDGGSSSQLSSNDFFSNLFSNLRVGNNVPVATNQEGKVCKDILEKEKVNN